VLYEVGIRNTPEVVAGKEEEEEGNNTFCDHEIKSTWVPAVCLTFNARVHSHASHHPENQQDEKVDPLGCWREEPGSVFQPHQATKLWRIDVLFEHQGLKAESLPEHEGTNEVGINPERKDEKGANGDNDAGDSVVCEAHNQINDARADLQDGQRPATKEDDPLLPTGDKDWNPQDKEKEIYAKESPQLIVINGRWGRSGHSVCREWKQGGGGAVEESESPTKNVVCGGKQMSDQFNNGPGESTKPLPVPRRKIRGSSS